MKKKVLIVEDQFVEANDLQLMLKKAGYHVCGIARSVTAAQEMIKKEEPELVLLDIFLKGTLTGIDLARELREENIPFIFLSANSNTEVLNAAKETQPDGFLVKPFREKDVLIALDIAAYRHEHSMEFSLKKEKVLKDKLAAIIADPVSLQHKITAIGKALQTIVPFDFLTAGVGKNGVFSQYETGLLRIGYDEYQEIGVAELVSMTSLKRNDIAMLACKTVYSPDPAIFNEAVFEQLCFLPSLHQLFSTALDMQACVSLSLCLGRGNDFVFYFYSKKSNTYSTDHTGTLERLQDVLKKGVESGLAGSQEHSMDRSNSKEGNKPSGNSRVMPGFEGIIGRSHHLLNVFDLITQVAPSDASVLILGESGTGKECIADCIHQRSPRKDKPFVKVNCAALPASLIESELFGHEKGSFTGALDKRIGKFEKADKGTIFLDEIGDMPIDIQAKILRVLQERCFERVGAEHETKIDVRIIAATNRNLEKDVAGDRFRLDLFYRLNVFPIELPPLRERIEDIPALAEHFIKQYSQKNGKKISGIADSVLKNMMVYHWPGNIRELENLIERGVLLAKGETIENIALSAAQTAAGNGDNRSGHLKTSQENERDHIIDVLKKCNRRIFGAGGAAELLKLPPTTLVSKMKKLGIRKEFIG